MKKIYFFMMAAMMAFAAISCDDDDNKKTTPGGNDGGDEEEEVFTDILAAYVDKTVLPTYTDMKNKAWVLCEAVEVFCEEEGTQDQLDAVCQAWRDTRKPWEESEAFLFGPADYSNLDPLLDSWPLDQPQIEQVLNGTSYIDGGSLGVNVRGFHTLEYLVFLDGHERDAATFTARQKDYLRVVAQELRNDCLKLWAAWNGAEGISDEEWEVIEEFEIGMPSPETGYGYEFKNAGKRGSRLLSQNSAIEFIIEGCMDIAGEVGEQKIGTPYNLATQNPEKALYQVESWYSWNSLTDYEDNIISIENSYMGGRKGNRGASLSSFVKEKNAALDEEIKDAIERAYNEIHKIKFPFRNNLLTDRTQIAEAMDACADLSNSMEKIKTLLD